MMLKKMRTVLVARSLRHLAGLCGVRGGHSRGELLGATRSDEGLAGLADLKLETVSVLEVGQEEPDAVEARHGAADAHLGAAEEGTSVGTELGALGEEASAGAVEHQRLAGHVEARGTAVAVRAHGSAAVGDGLELRDIAVQVQDTGVIGDLETAGLGVVPLEAVVVEVHVGSLLELLGVADSKGIGEDLGVEEVGENDLVRDGGGVDEIGATAVDVDLLSGEDTGKGQKNGNGRMVGIESRICMRKKWGRGKRKK